MKSVKIFLIIFQLLAMAAKGQKAQIITVENEVLATNGAAGWFSAQPNHRLAIHDRIRTLRKSRATVHLTGLYSMRMEQLTTVEISPSLLDDSKPRLDLGGGALFIFSREQSGEIDIKTPAANGALRGTQLFVKVDANGKTFYQVLEGRVQVSNPQGRVDISAGEAAEAVPGSAPRRTAVLEAKNLLEWALYYPAVIDPGELELEVANGEGDASKASTALQAYSEGDLLAALDLPKGGSKALEAAVLLAVGRLDEVWPILAKMPVSSPNRRALQKLVSAVKNEKTAIWPLESISTASEAMAESYYRQSQHDLEGAREAARLAVQLSPQSGYAWTRLGELEFSFGRAARALEALENGLKLTPRNAQAHALNGFVLSAQNRIGDAQQAFRTATQFDGALGNGWLGLGLTKIKQGQFAEGRADLQTAATVEPLMSIYHSYLGKAFSVESRHADAEKDLSLAQQLDANDPTPWLYSAIEKQQQNRSNEAIDDLQRSIDLNDNRRVYRSEFLLDQDKSVRSANLAAIYRNNGMDAVALREAAGAVDSDFTNASAHLFLANAFHSLRDPQRIALRYETPWFNELLLANLLSPVGGGPLSQYVSQQEYSKLLEADGIGASLAGEYRGTGEWRSSASVFGTHGKWSWGVDYSLRDTHGTRINNEASIQELYAQVKWQPTSDDTLYFLGKWSKQESGDTFETYDNTPLAPDVFFDEKQQPGLLLAGWNHRWGPGSHTLFLAGRLSATQRLRDPRANQLLIERDPAVLNPSVVNTVGFFNVFSDPAFTSVLGLDGETLINSPELVAAIQPFLNSGAILGVNAAPFDFQTRREFEIYTAEMMHIQKIKKHHLLAGVRYQDGEFETQSRLSVIRPNFAGGFMTPAFERTDVVNFQRLSLYAYDYWQPKPWLTITGGASWDRIDHPLNFRNPPTSGEQTQNERVSAKAGFTLKPLRGVQVRGAFTQGLGGVTYDESVRLEPVQIAGFNQSYRTVISESLAGSVETPRFQNIGLSLEGMLPMKTWWGITGNIIDQEVDRTMGAFTGFSPGVFPIEPAYFASSTRQSLSYREESVQFTLNQLVGKRWALGGLYRVTESELRNTMHDLMALGAANGVVHDRATMHELGLSANYNSPRGFFARAEANFFSQSLRDDLNALPAGITLRGGESFWQFNAFVGYRFNRNLCELSAGVLNLTDQNYQLSPLNPWSDIPRERTFVVRFRLSF